MRLPYVRTHQKRDLCLWVCPAPGASNVQSEATSGANGSSGTAPKRDSQLLKCSIRSAFRSFTVSRKPTSSLLSLQFIKERRRDKVFHKLGMKKVQVLFWVMLEHESIKSHLNKC
ncbi:unnamed protein product [Gongylonema pulchrum]|uniref:Uncharacterized protein n=1 Tax=Gongylonema pulchrum TaxID=637853 RepID=A0A183DDQ0_9BILA|nr:unnamed protein product [Gongylonema pulchrum]